MEQIITELRCQSCFLLQERYGEEYTIKSQPYKFQK